jgi:hypothetical protein
MHLNHSRGFDSPLTQIHALQVIVARQDLSFKYLQMSGLYHKPAPTSLLVSIYL